MSAQRLIAHLDMDAFYASVELLRFPELVGLPVVIGGSRANHPEQSSGTVTLGQRRFATLHDYAGRGVITTSTYAARAFGVHSGMGLMKAAKLAPQTILLPVDMDEYRKYSRLFKAAVRAVVADIEDRGIDEIYFDLTPYVAHDPHPWEAARTLALTIKEAVRADTGLSCSIGITPNKLLSKIASDLDKPDGLTVLREEDIGARIWPLPVRKINGIGPKASARLEALGISTIGELAAAEPQWLLGHFGQSYGAWLHAAAQGLDQRPVTTCSEPKSISRETTFDRDLHAVRDRAELSQIFSALCIGVANDLQRKGYAGKTIGLKLRFDDFRTVTRDQTIPHATQDARTIRRAAGECLKRVPLDKRLRLLGVRVGSLVPPGDAQPEADIAYGTTLPLFASLPE